MVSVDQALTEIRRLVAELCDLPEGQIPNEGVLRGFGISSTNVIELIAALEARFGLELVLEDMEQVRTILDLAEYVRQQGAGAGES